MEKQKFVRYNDFEKYFGVDLKNFSQKKVTSGNKGNYYNFLQDLRNKTKFGNITSKKDFQDLMKKNNINTSKPGLAQVLTGLGIVIKIPQGRYVMNVNRIDKKTAEFLFEYNYFKQKTLNRSKQLSLRPDMDLDSYEQMLENFEFFENMIKDKRETEKKPKRETEKMPAKPVSDETEYLRRRNIIPDNSYDLVIGFDNGTEEKLTDILKGYKEEFLKEFKAEKENMKETYAKLLK